MNFNALAWAAVCFYYRSVGDKKYSRIMSDTPFIRKLRKAPFDTTVQEFEEKLILDYVNIESYDLLLGHKFAEAVLARIVELQPQTSSFQNTTILDCDLSDDDIVGRINRIYAGLYTIYGMRLTGASKILHVLHDRLFPIMDSRISDYFSLVDGETKLIEWMKLVQQNAREVTKDFHEQGFSGSPETFLSDKLGYTRRGYEKSLVKFIDEYFYLSVGDNLPVPPTWVPS